MWDGFSFRSFEFKILLKSKEFPSEKFHINVLIDIILKIFCLNYIDGLSAEVHAVHLVLGKKREKDKKCEITAK